VTAHLTARARSGDQEAFRELVQPYQYELQVHCYRILGSAQDAEDALQETLLAAWRGLGDFEERASIRTWLYRIATSRCLNTLRASSRRATMDGPQAWPDPPTPTRLGEVPWLEPYPDQLLEQLPGTEPGPEARYESTEAISLAFVTALQLLPPRQRAVLVLRDVLGFRAAEAADILQTSLESVTSALKRARATLARQPADSSEHEPPAAPGSAAERDLVRRLTEAYATGNVNGVISLLTDDVWLTMPPVPFEYQGRDVGTGTVPAVRPRDALPAGAHPRQRTARVRHLRARPALRGPARQRPDGPHPRRRAHQCPRPLRQQQPGPLRPAPHPPSLISAAASRCRSATSARTALARPEDPARSRRTFTWSTS